MKAGTKLSHPTWVRGLKLFIVQTAFFHRRVAPYVGAWIETRKGEYTFTLSGVAPYVGAWIETAFPEWYNNNMESHPTWVRGLKQEEWNEEHKPEKSHPTWVRGLKPC